MVARYSQASYQTVVALTLMLGIMVWQSAHRGSLQEEGAR
jgi:branched-chain amino acid transport system permease protein